MTDNPSVNRSLDDEHFDHIDHALGRPAFPLQQSHRNYFAIGAGDLASRFAASHHWKLGGKPGDMLFFHVTPEGRQALADYLAKARPDELPYRVRWLSFSRIVVARSPSAARADYYRTLRDVMPDLGFLEFCRNTRTERAK
jgi:hypothetical protein